jgi:glycosyltransferase involved in cell wall biosynthesis
MNILLTNDELHEIRGGTQVFVADLARALRERGHGVAIYAWLRGSMAEEIEAAGVPVVPSPRDCGFVPDLIHGQHHLAAMTAITAFPGVPAVFHCHGYSPWQERPPVHPRIVRYIGMAHAMAGWIAGVTGRPREDIVILPNSVHLGRFNRIRQPGLRPRRAALFGNAIVPPEHLSKLQRACRESGLTLDLIGDQFGTATPAPQEVLPEYDLVFAIGRSALEALASGCGVVLFSAAGCGAMVEPSSLSRLSRTNFTVPSDAPALTVGAIVRMVREFEPGRCAAVTAAVRAQFGFHRTCDELETLYRKEIAGWSGGLGSSAGEESLAVSAYLSGLGPHVKGADERFAALRAVREKSRLRNARLKLRLAALQKRWDLVERRLPSIVRRWLLR